ncbi:MAG: hypothetical protein RIE73_05075 [Coleofasciculus sp. C1-SOL-03]|uniref:hypothetical protein n=1 Tax=Coleofasciculus sp. C1-SOL-03 TaxID=3069522 RepID=UPI0032F6F264
MSTLKIQVFFGFRPLAGKWFGKEFAQEALQGLAFRRPIDTTNKTRLLFAQNRVQHIAQTLSLSGIDTT